MVVLALVAVVVVAVRIIVAVAVVVGVETAVLDANIVFWLVQHPLQQAL